MRGRRARRVLAAVAVAAAAAAPVAAQQVVPPAEAEVRTLDQERLFQESRFGQRVADEIEQASRALAAENRRIEAELAEEERRLTEEREALAPAEFREKADAFDTRVTRIRREQEEKSRAISRRSEIEQQRFFDAALPVLGELLQQMGASVILDDRAVILSSQRIDITDAAIRRLDATIGAGTPAEDAPELPEAERDDGADLDADEHDGPEGPPLELSIPDVAE